MRLSANKETKLNEANQIWLVWTPSCPDNPISGFFLSKLRGTEKSYVWWGNFQGTPIKTLDLFFQLKVFSVLRKNNGLVALLTIQFLGFFYLS